MRVTKFEGRNVVGTDHGVASYLESFGTVNVRLKAPTAFGLW
jgi:hypothetical protein